jgi:hypothetical protein
MDEKQTTIIWQQKHRLIPRRAEICRTGDFQSEGKEYDYMLLSVMMVTITHQISHS